jgi:hypothetical protein
VSYSLKTLRGVLFGSLPVLVLTCGSVGQGDATSINAWTSLTGSPGARTCSNQRSPISFCKDFWTDSAGNQGTGYASAVTSYGALKLSVRSFVRANSAQGGTLASNSSATASANDILSFVGLTVPATLEVQSFLFSKPDGSPSLSTAQYTVAFGGINPECLITNKTLPSCTLTTPITPGLLISLQRLVTATAIATLTNFPAGASCTTAIRMVFPGATVRISVLNAKGHIVKGVSVVGASGHIYN